MGPRGRDGAHRVRDSSRRERGARWRFPSSVRRTSNGCVGTSACCDVCCTEARSHLRSTCRFVHRTSSCGDLCGTQTSGDVCGTSGVVHRTSSRNLQGLSQRRSATEQKSSDRDKRTKKEMSTQIKKKK